MWWQYLVCSVVTFGLLLAIAFVISRVLFMVACFLACVLGGSAIGIYFATTGIQRPQTIEITNGQVFYKSPLAKRIYALSECTWDLDARLEDSMWFPISRLLSKTDAIMLQTGTLWKRHVVFCCVDVESRKLWTEFLTFAANHGTTTVSDIPAGST